SLQCWGDNFSGQIGNNSTAPAPFPVTVQGLPSGSAVTISTGYAYSCTAVDRGFAYCWGGNLSGELSTTDTAAAHLTPTPVVGDNTNSLLTDIVQISTGTGFFFNLIRRVFFPVEHTCALRATGVIDCWGANSNGEIGDGTTIQRPRPTAVNSFLANVDPAA